MLDGMDERDPSPEGARGGWLARRLRAAGGYLAEDVWSRDLAALSLARRAGLKLLRVAYLATRGFADDRCLLRAGALTFITGLSIVPLLAFAFSVAKGLGAYDRLLNGVIRPFLDDVLGPSGDVALSGTPSQVEVRSAVDQVLLFVQDTQIASLGTFGLAILVYTIIKLLGAIEASFNDIWGVKKARTLVRKVADYLSIVVIVPILLTSAAAASAAIQSAQVTGFLERRLHLGGVGVLYARSASLLATWIGFAFVYLFLPNTRVRVRSALLGGILGGTLWQVAQVLHVRFQVGVANYNALYSTFAALPIFMFWLYLSWITVLLGAELACAHQSEPAYRQIARARAHDHAFLEVLALRLMTRAALAFLRGEGPRSIDRLCAELGVPERSVEEVLAKLERAGIAALAVDEHGRERLVLPARAPAHVRIQDVLDALTGKRAPAEVPGRAREDRVLGEALARLEDERRTTGANVTLETLGRRALESDPTEATAGRAAEGRA